MYYDRMKIVRKVKKESQQKVADILGIDQRQYSRYEQGKNEMPIRHLITLCRHWKIKSDYLLELEDSPN